MGQAYPELIRAEALITETLKLEETRFRRTLERGLMLLDEATTSISGGETLPGEVAFKLYDTYGFPFDLTADALKARNIGVDRAGFDAAMERQRAEARKAWAGSGEAATERVWFELRDRVGASEFLGYETEKAEGQIVGIVKGGKEVKQIRKGEEGAIIVNQTPFYGMSGGQVGDRGEIRGPKGALFTVTDTEKKLGDLFVHMGTAEKGSFKLGDAVELEVDHGRRTAIRANHSATHLVHEALRQVLGTHVAQKGSLVAPGRLRFDFSHPKPMTPEEIQAAEELANAMVLRNEPVVTRLMAVDDAIASGAMALFGEKYGDEVRVVSMGTEPAGEKAAKTYSVELCGGTHVRRLGDIGLIKIIAETAVAAGVRRIEALTAEGARAYLNEQDRLIRAAAGVLKVRPEELPARLLALTDEKRRLERELTAAKKAIALGDGDAARFEGGEVRQVGQVRLMARTVQGIPPKDLRGLVDEGKRKIGSGVVAIVGVSDEGKAGIIVGVTDDLTGDYSAVDLVRAGAEALGGGGGGGRPDMAQAGGPDGSQAEAALAAIEKHLAAGAKSVAAGA
jgi:alanyl-tRNA synthetase